MKRTHVTSKLVCSLLLFLSAFPGAIAGNPDKAGGGGESNGGGTIYFSYKQQMHVMSDDGSGIRVLTNFPGSHGIPSYTLHNSKRWFLQDGGLFIRVVSDSGDVVLLDPGVDVDPLSSLSWGHDDAFISFTGNLLGEAGNVIAGGLFEIDYTVDSEGNITGAAGPAVLTFETPLYFTGDNLRPDIAYSSWFPDNRLFVYCEASPDAPKQLLIGDVDSGLSVTLFDDPTAKSISSPRCSPAGDKVMFQYRPDKGHSRVMLINTDGTGLKLLARGSVSWSKGVGVWSPRGSHLLFHHWDHFYEDSYIQRATSSGSRKVRLTDMSLGAGFSTPFAQGWRD